MEGLPIALVRIGDEVDAIGDRCTHENASLSEGERRELEWLAGDQTPVPHIRHLC